MDGTTKTPVSVWKAFSEEGQVRIRSNELLTGVLDKNQFGASENGLVHVRVVAYLLSLCFPLIIFH